MRHTTRYFTVVGYLSGFLYMFLKGISSNLLWQILSIVIGFYFFDLFHFDGLLDTFDGFFYQGDEKKRMEIMSKGNIGPFAVFFAFFFCAAYLYAFVKTEAIALIYMGVFGRFSMNILMNISRPAKEKGLGSLFYPYDTKNTFWSLAFTAPLIFNLKFYLASITIAFLAALIMKLLTEKKIDGYTGDVLGATCLLSQLFIISVPIFLEK